MKTKVIFGRPTVVRLQAEQPPAAPPAGPRLSAARALLTAAAALALLSLSGCRLFFAETDSLDAYLAGAYTSPGAVTPNDTFYVDGYHWHYSMVDLPRAWGILTDPEMLGAFAITYVAVVDTGIVRIGVGNHPDLGANVLYDPGSDQEGYDFIGTPDDFRKDDYDLDGDDQDPEDAPDPTPGSNLDPTPNNSWHGTHVAGTIAALTDNGSGIAGVGWNRLRVVPIRSLNDYGGYTTDVAEGVLYAAGFPPNGVGGPGVPVRVINLSLGGGGQDPYFYEAIEDAVGAGITVVAAAGNKGGKVIYPAANDNTIAVSAVDASRGLAVYSNFGPEVDFAAPGGDRFEDVDANGAPDGVLSTIGDPPPPTYSPQFTEGTTGNRYAYFEGTSMATPHVAGIVGLLYSYEPNLTQSDVYTILLNSAEDLGEPGRDDSYGWGLVQAGRALEYLINAGREHGVAPSGGALSPQAGGGGSSVGIAGVIPGTRPRGVVPQRRGALRPTPGAERHPTQILLRLEDAAAGGRRPSLAETARQAEALGNLHPGARLAEPPVRGPGVIVLEAADPAGWLTLLEELAADPAVRYAQPVYRYRIIE